MSDPAHSEAAADGGLAAGFDARAYRLPQLRGIPFYEVDCRPTPPARPPRCAGSTTETMDKIAAEQFEPFGELLSEITKFAALLVFGALITPERLSHLSVGGWVLAVVAIVLVRPPAMALWLLRTSSGRERATAAWFGPKGFASVVYGLLALQPEIADSEVVFDLVAVTIALSMTLSQATDRRRPAVLPTPATVGRCVAQPRATGACPAYCRR
ncbi:class I SAM-dependent methyltransferase [Amycolatopsis sp. RTGN1]|uniref:class I SAM-dependent methyltransferase n=1 Tax=Amycolatopsis ponsaeliensis TaxID=2992142 RepID=UPI0033073E59